MANPSIANPPAPIGTKALTNLQGKQKRFITILQDDFQFDIIERIVKHIRQLEKAKRIKPLDKAKMLQTYYLTLLNYCIPKMKLTEDESSKIGDRIKFSINIGGQAPASAQQPSAGNAGVHISIPTVKQADGSYTVDSKAVKP